MGDGCAFGVGSVLQAADFFRQIRDLLHAFGGVFTMSSTRAVGVQWERVGETKVGEWKMEMRSRKRSSNEARTRKTTRGSRLRQRRRHRRTIASQLTLVAAAKDVPSIWQFFSYLTSIVNFVTSSPKRLNDLQSAQQEEIAYMLAIGERKSGTGANQVGTLHRSGATRWSSHYDSVRNLIDMYAATCKILGNLSENGPNGAIRGEASGLCNIIMSFEFVFVLFLMEKILETTDILCQALQNKSQDIVNALKFVSTTKAILLKFREDGWDEFFEKVKAFCERHNIEMPNMSGGYKVSRYCQQRNHVTVEHHYHYDIFNAAIDFQMMELNYRFSEATMELLALCSALDPTDSFKKFNVDDICKLASKFYPMDFTQQEIHALKAELEHYQFDIVCDPEFQQISTLSALYREMIVTKKAESYVMIQRLIRLVLTLPPRTVKDPGYAIETARVTQMSQPNIEGGEMQTLSIEKICIQLAGVRDDQLNLFAD
ncbi:uncharacterized protein LOC141846466 [Curcuma longa]|uniref:uncharacterized protein LOC141846466 n=1 Tax=Curcuma longa TaxID=136217 RepID=UPI003D9FB13E